MKKAVSGIMLTLLLLSMFTMAFNVQSVKAASAMFSVVKTRTLEPGDNLIHGFVYHEGYLWASTRTSPCRILKIDPETLDYERVILDAGLDDGEDLIAADGYIWVILYTSPSKIIRVDPETLVWEVAVSFQSDELSNGGSLEYAFGYLWAGGSDGKIAKIDLSSLTYVIYSYSVVVGYTYTAALTRGGGYLWASCPHSSWWQGWYADTIVRINSSNPSDYTSVYMSTLMCDDMAYVDGYLYTGSEESPSYVYKISDSLTYSSAKASDTLCYAIFAHNGSIWGAYVGSPGKIVELDLDLNIKATYQLPLGFNDANEIAFDTAGNMYVTCWESPAKIVKLSPPTPDFSIAASPTSLTIQQGNSDTSVITITSVNGFNQPVQLIVSGAPSGVTATLNPEQVTPPPDGLTTSTLTVSVGTTATAGSYSLTVTGKSDAITHRVNISLDLLPESNIIKSFPAPSGTQPNGLAWDGNNLWMSSYMLNGGIYKLDPADGSVLNKYTPPVAQYDGYGGLTYDGTYLWEADAYGGGIYKLNPSDCSVVSIIPSPDNYPSDLAWDGSHIWVCGYPTQKIYKISPTDGSIMSVFNVPQGTGQAQTAGLAYDGAYLWLSGINEIFKLDPLDCGVIYSFLAPCSRPDSLAWDGRYLWCASFDKGLIYQIDVGIPENKPPTCVVQLRKNGVEISEIDVWEFFDIHVGASTDDTGIVQVRFSSDDVQDGNPTGEWTDWFNWTSSSGDWNASTKIKRWAFATPGYKEVWAQVKDDLGQSAKCSANVQAILPAIVITSPLEITPKGPYYTGDSLTAKFTIKNIGDVPVNLDVLTAGGRDPDGLVIDFDWERNIVINPNDEHVHTGKLTLPSRAGNYHFFCAYRTQYGYWNPSVDLGEGLTDEDRVEDVMVLERYPLGGIIVPIEIFPEGNGCVIPIYVPPVIDNSNALRDEDGWETIKEIERSKLNFEWEKMISSLTLERAEVWSPEQNKYVDTPQGAAFSFMAGFITAVNNAFSRSKVKITIQRSPEGNFRAIIQWGDPDVNSFMRTYAGDVKVLAFQNAFVQAAFNQYIAEAFHLEPAGWTWDYGMVLQIDSSHKEDEYVYYVSLSQDNRILLTPKIYKNDKLSINRVYFLVWPKTVVELAGDSFVSFEKSLLSTEETKSILEMLDPILLLPKSAIITIGQSPCEFRVYDSHGNVTGLVNGKIKEQIPNSMYFNVSKTIVIFNPIDTYYYEVVGIDTGVYHLKIISVENRNITTFTASNIPIIANATHQYTVNWSALSHGEEGVTVKVDSDGDGVFELTFTSDSELTRDEFMLHFPTAEAFPMWILGIVVATISIATLAIVVLWRKRKLPRTKG